MNALIYLLPEDFYECFRIEKNGGVGKMAKSGLSCWSGLYVASFAHTREYWSGNQGHLENEVSTAIEGYQGTDIPPNPT